MIALDTNALVRMLIEDDCDQALLVQRLVKSCEESDTPILILSEVLIETVWVLESVYSCTRSEISEFLEALSQSTVFVFSEPGVIMGAIQRYKKGGDFADLIIVMQAINHNATKIFSFDKQLQKIFPDYVSQTIP